MNGAQRILLINDDEPLSKYLRDRLTVNGEYSISLEFSARSGLEIFSHNSFDIVIAKFGMPDLEGIELVKELKNIDPDSIIIILVEEANPRLLKEMYRLGVYDSIGKPINLEKLAFLIKKGMDLHSLMVAHRKLRHGLQEHNVDLQKQNILLAKRIEESTKNLTRLYEDLRQTYMRTIKALAQAIDARDHYTHSHSENVAKIAVTIAEEMDLSAAEIEMIRDACELHDLGKIGVEDNILGKPSALTDKEWEQIKRHPQTAVDILEPLTFLNGVIDLVRQHHEHYDGTGYPVGRKRDDILLGARIIHVADAYEAMRSPRSYRKVPFSKEEAVLEIKKHSGTQFDPIVVEAFLKVSYKL
jgi:putative nucleotidyltransferase with HDIG domain